MRSATANGRRKHQREVENALNGGPYVPVDNGEVNSSSYSDDDGEDEPEIFEEGGEEGGDGRRVLPAGMYGDDSPYFSRMPVGAALAAIVRADLAHLHDQINLVLPLLDPAAPLPSHDDVDDGDGGGRR